MNNLPGKSALLILSFILLLFTNGYSQAEWVAQSKEAIGIGGAAQGNDIVIDDLGNIFVIGDYTGEVMIDTVFCDDFGSVYLAKYSSDGTLIWGRPFKGGSNNDGVAVALNDSGHVYIAGIYNQTNSTTLLDFGGLTLAGNGEDNCFLAKADTSGTFKWAISILAENLLGGQFVRPTDIEVDQAGNILMIGELNAPITIDGQMYNTTTFQNNNTAQFFFARFFPDGSLDWIRFMEQSNAGKYFLANDMKPASNGDMFMTGLMSDDGLRYGNDSLFHIGIGDDSKFVARFDATNGDLLWYQTFSVQAQNQEAHEIGVDAADNVYTTMRLGGRVWLPDTNYFPTDLRGRYQLLKFSGIGERLWIKEIAHTEFPTSSGINEQSIALTTASNGTIFIAANFTGFSNWMVIGQDTFPIKDPSTEGFTQFIAAYNADGLYLDAGFMIDEYLTAGPGADEWQINSLKLGSQNHLFMTGSIEGSYRLGSDTLTAGFLNQMFLVEVDTDSLLMLSTPLEPDAATWSFRFYPNPADDYITVEAPELAMKHSAEVALYTLHGQFLQTWHMDQPEMKVNLSPYEAGTYLLRIRNASGSMSQILILR